MHTKKRAAPPSVACRFFEERRLWLGDLIARWTVAAGRNSCKYGSWAWPAAAGDGAVNPKETMFWV